MSTSPDSAAQDKATAPSPRRRLRRVLLRTVLALAVLFLILQFALGSIVRHAAKVAGPAFLGTPISISSVHARLFSGLVSINGLVVGPPEGFDANVFALSSFRIDLDTASLLRSSSPIHIREILIESPEVSYEIKGLGNTNLKAILDRIAKAEKEEEAKPEEEREKGRKVVIDRFLFHDGKVRVAVWDGKGAVVPLPTIELTDIGAKSGGATGLEAFGQVLRSIGVGTAKAAAGVVGDVAGLAVDAVKGVGGAAAGAVRGIGGLLGIGGNNNDGEEK